MESSTDVEIPYAVKTLEPIHFGLKVLGNYFFVVADIVDYYVVVDYFAELRIVDYEAVDYSEALDTVDCFVVDCFEEFDIVDSYEALRIVDYCEVVGCYEALRIVGNYLVVDYYEELRIVDY
jgi:hypothetical protein